jgi:hypothetical protein
VVLWHWRRLGLELPERRTDHLQEAARALPAHQTDHPLEQAPASSVEGRLELE